MPRKIGIATTNSLKFKEFKEHFKRYGVQAVQLQVGSSEKKAIEELGLMGVLSEQTILFSLSTQEEVRGFPEDFDSVNHISELVYCILKDGAIQQKMYHSETQGTIDHSRNIDPLPEDCYHWDAVFVVDRCGLSLYEIKKKTGQKISSRDLNIAQFLRENLHYKKSRDLYYRPQNMKTVIDFDENRAVDMLCSLVHEGSDFIRFPLAVLNQGVFLRSADSRRSFVYWCPGLNAGLPLVPKPKDFMHEKTFMFHDLIHFLLPDLIFDGQDSPLHKLCYIAYRMSSELISLVMADMLYVHQSTEEYVTVNQRKIYPLFQAMGENIDWKLLFEGAFRYGFYEDDSIWREQIQKNGGALNALDDFRGKYDNYILQDFRWTFHNWECMIAQKEDFKIWWEDFGQFTHQVQSISDFIHTHDLEAIKDKDEVLHQIYQIMVQQILSILQKPIPPLDSQSGMKQAIDNYLVGQSRIFYRYDFLSQTQFFRDRMKDALSQETRPAIGKLRQLYRKYLGILLENRLINPDDVQLYEQVYPIFDFLLVNYEKRPEIKPLVQLGIS